MGFTVNGDTSNAEFETGRKLGQRRLGAFAARQAVGDDADMMAAIGLSIGEIQDVAEDSANRRAYRMQNSKWLV
jgi:hypothetical protein